MKYVIVLSVLLHFCRRDQGTISFYYFELDSQQRRSDISGMTCQEVAVMSNVRLLLSFSINCQISDLWDE